jgi:hypothetical protein
MIKMPYIHLKKARTSQRTENHDWSMFNSHFIMFTVSVSHNSNDGIQDWNILWMLNIRCKWKYKRPVCHFALPWVIFALPFFDSSWFSKNQTFFKNVVYPPSWHYSIIFTFANVLSLCNTTKKNDVQFSMKWSLSRAYRPVD